MPPTPPATATKVLQIAASAMHAEWTVIYDDHPEMRLRVICFAVRQSDSTVVPLIYDDASNIIVDAGVLGAYNLT